MNSILPDFEDDHIPYGVAGASFSFPLSPYDRFPLALANLTRGSMGAAGRSLIAPNTLSPSELLTFQKQVMGNKKNPLLKTLLDISTNPLFIMGAIASIAYPVGSSRALFEIAEGIRPIAAKVGPLMSHIYPAFMALRNFAPLSQKINNVSAEASSFLYEFGHEATRILGGAGKLSTLDQTKLAGYVQGWNKHSGTVGALFKDVGSDPIMPNLRSQMSPELISTGDNISNLFKKIRNKFPDTTMDAIVREMDSKGIKIGRWLVDYWPQLGYFDRFENAAVKDVLSLSSSKGYAEGLKNLTATGIASSMRQRRGGMIPNMVRMKEAEAAGIIRPGFVSALEANIEKAIGQASAALDETLGKAVDASVLATQKAMGKTPDLLGGDRTLQFFDRTATDTFIKKLRVALKSEHYNIEGRLGGGKTGDLRLRKIAQHLFAGRSDPALYQKNLREAAEAIARPSEYSLDTTHVLQQYISKMSNTYAWHGTGLGKEIGVLVDSLNNTGWNGQSWAKPYVEEQLLPLVRGYKTQAQFWRGQNWMEMKKGVVDWLVQSPLSKHIPEQSKKWMLDYWDNYGPSTSVDSVGGHISRWFQLSTLGANMSSSIKNLMQPLLTTMPLFGVKNTAKGLATTIEKYSQYTGFRAAGLGHEEAFVKAFPDFVQAMGARSDIIKRMAAGDLVEDSGMLPRGVRTGWDKIKTVMMTPFGAAETQNQLLSFYVGKNAALSEGYIGKAIGDQSAEAIEAAANRFGKWAVETTQFTGGPLGLPKGLVDIWPPFRQFMHFPLRYAGFLTGGTRLGEKNLQLGTLGRGVAASTALYYGAKNLAGVDLSQGLMTGALPLPSYENAPFYPFPFVPPMIGAAGSVAQAAFSGDTKSLGSAGALMVPGGVPGRRLYRTLSKTYADYENRQPDGRIAVYNDKQALVGLFTPLQLTLKAIGLTPSSVTAEQGATQWILKQRDQIRAYRQQYLQALTENDTNKAQAIQEAWKSQYPELGEIQVSKQDIKAIDNRRQVARLERVMKGIPAQYRPLFQQITATASLGQIAPDIEQNPAVAQWYQ